ncbi:MAG: outer membrane lipoprotein carrier protein LolA [Planctomycetota bacterium]|nr:outer membrane lipoprotein carrier protein LolA [Planctomycetota bacterium]
MSRYIRLTMTICIFLSASAAGAPDCEPATLPATLPTTRPATMKILRNLEQTGDEYATVRADVNYHVEMPQTGDSETRSGWVAYQKQSEKAAAKFRIHFETLRLGAGRKTRDRVDYAFDGKWLSVKKHRIRQMTRYQLADDNLPTKEAQPLRLGKGPFPIPFGQKADDVLKYFRVQSRPAAPKEPQGCDYLKLTPYRKFRREMDFVRLEMWIDRERHLPAKIISVDKNKDERTVIFDNIKTNVRFNDAMFHLPRPAGWQLRVEPLRKGDKIAP